MGKKEIILDTMRELFIEGKAGTASVSDIAKKAGIAKGGMYYYFRSKEEVMDALVLREYEDIIAACEKVVEESGGSALEKLALLMKTYRSAYVDTSLDEYLHMPQNAAIHQKSLAQILSSLSRIITRIIEQGAYSRGTMRNTRKYLWRWRICWRRGSARNTAVFRLCMDDKQEDINVTGKRASVRAAFTGFFFFSSQLRLPSPC